MTSTKALALTPGEPAGIGPDLVVQLAQQELLHDCIIIADPVLLIERAMELGLPLNIVEAQAPCEQLGTVRVHPIHRAEPCLPGVLNSANAQYVVDTLMEAGQGALEGRYSGIVTAPVHKGIINDSGIKFSGHTELFADICGGITPVMMLATEGLRVALVTTHLPLRDIADAITAELIHEIITLLHHDLVHRFGIADPRIYVCGLNPHAGEGGHLGHEEIEIIEPALDKLRAQGITLIGPLPADTLFTPKYLDQADAVLAMYHDQGLPVLKHVGFGQAANITLGLPIIRTSVDHGTATDLAGTGKADMGSLKEALKQARMLVAASTK